MEPVVSLPHSQETATFPYSEPDSWTQFYRLARNDIKVVVNSLKVDVSLTMYRR
jgi:hypothetical protein